MSVSLSVIDGVVVPSSSPRWYIQKRVATNLQSSRMSTKWCSEEGSLQALNALRLSCQNAETVCFIPLDPHHLTSDSPLQSHPCHPFPAPPSSINATSSYPMSTHFTSPLVHPTPSAQPYIRSSHLRSSPLPTNSPRSPCLTSWHFNQAAYGLRL